MPSLEENQLFWGKSYDWDAAGNEWSAAWGGAEMQWFGTILPRIPPAFADIGDPRDLRPGSGTGRTSWPTSAII